MNEVTRMTAPPTAVRSGTATDEFLSRAAVVYDGQRKHIIELEAEHERRRTEMKSGYGRKLADIAHEGAEALRRLEADHARSLANERAKLEAIERLRNA